MTLKFAPGLALPVDVAGEAIAILAKRGAGKTNTATVLVEELCERTGYSPAASTIGVILSKLRKLGLVEKGARRAAPGFMDAIA